MVYFLYYIHQIVAYCQTDHNQNESSKMTIEAERMLRDEFNRVTQENVELKKKKKKKTTNK